MLTVFVAPPPGPAPSLRCVMRLMVCLGGRAALQREVRNASRGAVIPS